MTAAAFDAAWSVLGEFGIQRQQGVGPVILGREILLQAEPLCTDVRAAGAVAAMLEVSASVLMAGILQPVAQEYPTETLAYARADAAMWFGIVSSAVVGAGGQLTTEWMPSRSNELRSMPDAMVLDLARTWFEGEKQFTKAGRCAEELGELLRAEGARDRGLAQLTAAVELFERDGNRDRADSARRRVATADLIPSNFFRSFDGTRFSWTICGSTQYAALRRAVSIASRSRP